MKWPFSHTLTRLVRCQKGALDKAFGNDTYQVRDAARDCCIVEGGFAVVTFTYSWRDQWVESSIQLQDLPEDIPTDTLLRFLGAEAPVRKGEPLNERPVKEEVHRVMLACEVFRDQPERAREALAFFDRECEEETRRYDDSE